MDLEPFLDAPFESASNRPFETLLAVGVALLATVAVVGRSTVVAGLVACYLLAIPAYVAYRARTWDGGTADGDGTGESGESGEESDGGDGDDETGDAGDSPSSAPSAEG